MQEFTPLAKDLMWDEGLQCFKKIVKQNQGPQGIFETESELLAD